MILADTRCRQLTPGAAGSSAVQRERPDPVRARSRRGALTVWAVVQKWAAVRDHPKLARSQNTDYYRQEY